MQRRRFIADTVKLALGARALAALGGGLAPLVVTGQAAQNFTAAELASLALMARALLPHDFLTDADYAAVVSALDRQSGREPALQDAIRGGLARMDALSGGDWLAATVDEKLRVLEQVQDEPFFGRVLNAGIETLYRDPEIFRRLGYQGSSIEHGGYLNRGFDDIDWLPAPD